MDGKPNICLFILPIAEPNDTLYNETSLCMYMLRHSSLTRSKTNPNYVHLSPEKPNYYISYQCMGSSGCK